MAALELLPNELLDEIIDFLSVPPLLAQRLHQPPSTHITTSRRTRDLKNLSLTSSRFVEPARPHLFSCGCFDVRDVVRYLSFIAESDLIRHVKSLVIKGEYGFDYPKLWRLLFGTLDPRRLTLIAPPSVIGEMLGMDVNKEHIWAFEIPYQTVQLECHRPKAKPEIQADCSRLLNILPWSSFFFNESSSLKAYNHYEYFLYKVPSILNSFAPWVSARPVLEQSRLFGSLANLHSFTYVAVFPFYNHVQLVLDAVDCMTNLRSLKIQLGPSENDRATELEQRGSMDASDPWMELATSYSLIAHAIRNRGRASCLETFTACDYRMEAVRSEIEPILRDVLGNEPWTHDGQGTWTKREDLVEGHATATDDA